MRLRGPPGLPKGSGVEISPPPPPPPLTHTAFIQTLTISLSLDYLLVQSHFIPTTPPNLLSNSTQSAQEDLQQVMDATPRQYFQAPNNV